MSPRREAGEPSRQNRATGLLPLDAVGNDAIDSTSTGSCRPSGGGWALNQAQQFLG